MSVINTLRERIESYDELTDIKLLRRVPVVIILNGRSFKKITSLLQKPFAPEFMELMCGTMIKLSQEIDGTIFSYTYNDSIVIIARNDQNYNTDAWFDNRVQKIVSASAAIATLEFNRLAKTNNIQLFGDPIFIARTFVVPNITEALNTLMAFQQSCYGSALGLTCFYELLKKYDIETVQQTIANRSPQEKIELLFSECGIDFNMLPLTFIRGVACYRAAKVINIGGDEKIKNKLIVDLKLPLFSKDREFLESIFRQGRDIIRI